MVGGAKASGLDRIAVAWFKDHFANGAALMAYCERFGLAVTRCQALGNYLHHDLRALKSTSARSATRRPSGRR
jgi:hypothetical protein